MQAFAFSNLSAIALFWTTRFLSFLLPFNFYPLAPELPSFWLQVWKEAANIFWVSCGSRGAFPSTPTLDCSDFFFPLNSPLLWHHPKSCTAQQPTPRVHFCVACFLCFYPLQSLSNFSYYLAKLPCNPSQISCQVEQELQQKQVSDTCKHTQWNSDSFVFQPTRGICTGLPNSNNSTFLSSIRGTNQSMGD